MSGTGDDLTRDEGPLDTSALEGLRELGGDEFLAELAGIFLDETPAHLTAIDQAFAADDCASIARSAHALKSSAANMGARQLQEILSQLEHGCRGGDMAGASALIGEMRSEYARVAAALEALRNP